MPKNWAICPGPWNCVRTWARKLKSIVYSARFSRTTHAAIRNIYDTWFDAFPDLEFRQNDLLVDGNRAVLFFTISGTHMKAFGGVPATKRHVEIRGVLLFELRDDKVVHEKRLYDSTSLLMQIGVIRAKPM